MATFRISGSINLTGFIHWRNTHADKLLESTRFRDAKKSAPRKKRKLESGNRGAKRESQILAASLLNGAATQLRRNLRKKLAFFGLKGYRLTLWRSRIHLETTGF